MINYDKEYHPVIEDYINEYTEGLLGESETKAFEEVLESDEEMKVLVEYAKKGRMLIAHLIRSSV